MAINDGIPPCVCQQLIPQIVELFDAYGWWLIIGLIDSILFLSATNTGTFRPTLIVNLHSQKKNAYQLQLIRNVLSAIC